MNPIFEKGRGQGIGYSYNRFFENFLDICEEHLESKRAKNFAFILYDFHNDPIREVLNTQGSFAQFDRLSGKDLTIFYLDSGDKKHIKKFNKIFLGAFEIEEKFEIPLVLFFKLKDKEVEDIEVVLLQQTNIMFTFQELNKIIENYVVRIKNESAEKFKPNKLIAAFHTVKKIALEKLIEEIIVYSVNKL